MMEAMEGNRKGPPATRLGYSGDGCNFQRLEATGWGRSSWRKTVCDN